MEGVGARLGRSSTRYGPATVFNGPVRKWKKKWVHVSPSNSSTHHSHTTTTTNGNNGSHLLLYKWTPISLTDKAAPNDDAAAAAVSDEPPRRKFKYVPIAVLEEHTNDGAENGEDEAKTANTNTSEPEPDLDQDPDSKSNGFDVKPDINDVPMEETQSSDKDEEARQDLNESTLDLSLGLKAHDGDADSDSKTDQTNDSKT